LVPSKLGAVISVFDGSANLARIGASLAAGLTRKPLHKIGRSDIVRPRFADSYFSWKRPKEWRLTGPARTQLISFSRQSG
jgi:hypothetical protein